MSELQLQMIDAHIHLDKYNQAERAVLLDGIDAANVTGLVTVSMDLTSSKANLRLCKQYQQVHAAFGFHPEQDLPTEHEKDELVSWITNHSAQMVAIGEVGLPYYKRQQADGAAFPYREYVELLEQFVQLASRLAKPIVLHAVYDDAPVVCDLLERYNVRDAHFHWFKGDARTVERLSRNSYMISITPDILYEQEIQELARRYPLEQMMVETDGPWPFAGQFAGQMTVPGMMHQTIAMISQLKRRPIAEVYQIVYQNTADYYRLRQLPFLPNDIINDNQL